MTNILYNRFKELIVYNQKLWQKEAQEWKRKKLHAQRKPKKEYSFIRFSWDNSIIMPLVKRRANQGNLFKQDTEPPDWLNGDLWSDTTDDSLKLNVSGTATNVGDVSQDTELEVNGGTFKLGQWVSM